MNSIPAPRRLPFGRLLLSGLVLFALSACKEEAEKGGEPVRPVKTMTVADPASTRAVRYSGSVRARVEAALGFRVPGKIVERLVSVGEKVETGRVLARLDQNDLKLSLQTAEANVVASRTRLEVAESNRERAKALAAKGFVAKSGLDAAGLEADQAHAALEAAMSSRDQAANQIGYADLTADDDGIVTDIRADVGQVVAAGTPVVVLAHDGEKEVAIAVPEQDVVHFTKDQAVKVLFWADRDLVLEGRVREIAGSADPASRTYAIRVSLADASRARLGMTATVEAAVPVARDSVVVPLAALVRGEGRPRVWIVDPATATVQPREVTLGPVDTDGVHVDAGLKPGDVVVTAGVQFLIPGKKIRLSDVPSAATR